jgi:hypothetical protein
MRLVECLNNILESMSVNFTQKRVFQLFKSHMITMMLMCCRGTVSNTICFRGRDQKDWAKEYRLYSTSQWNPIGCMELIIDISLTKLPVDTPFIPIAVDLTGFRKHGKHIPNTQYLHDPQSPPFQRGLLWGQRFLHASFILPKHQDDLPARGIPIRLHSCPYVKKPGKKASDEDKEAYKIARKERNASTATIDLFTELRDYILTTGERRRVLMIGDGGFCNQTCFKKLPEGVDVLARCRKDAKLCHSKTAGRGFYSTEKFTPQNVRQDATIPSRTERVFYGGNWREITFKEVTGIYWQRGAQRRPVRLITIQPVPYRRTGSGYKNYRDPAYLLTTDLTTCAKELVQFYFYRWEIEQNHRDMKNNMGLGQAQLWSEPAIERQPQTVMLAYSVLLLATETAYGGKRDEMAILKPPKWWKSRKRPSIGDMKRALQREIDKHLEWRAKFGLEVPLEEGDRRCSA